MNDKSSLNVIFLLQFFHYDKEVHVPVSEVVAIPEEVEAAAVVFGWRFGKVGPPLNAITFYTMCKPLYYK